MMALETAQDALYSLDSGWVRDCAAARDQDQRSQTHTSHPKAGAFHHGEAGPAMKEETGNLRRGSSFRVCIPDVNFRWGYCVGELL